MKLVICFLMLCLLFVGCSGKKNLETLGDPCSGELMKEPLEVVLELPEQVVDEVFQKENSTLYLGDQFSVSVQTLQGGDLDKTVRDCVGYGMDELTVMQTKHRNRIRYDSVCAVVGEGKEQILRFAIIDDGAYHYVVTAMVDATSVDMYSEQIGDILDSFSLNTDQ